MSGPFSSYGSGPTEDTMAGCQIVAAFLKSSDVINKSTASCGTFPTETLGISSVKFSKSTFRLKLNNSPIAEAQRTNTSPKNIQIIDDKQYHCLLTTECEVMSVAARAGYLKYLQNANDLFVKIHYGTDTNTIN